jgi:Flp pilus assembly CpaE family ATPase
VRPSKIEEVLKRKFFWTVPYDRQVRAGAQVGNPAVLGSPESNGAKVVVQMAEALTGATQVQMSKTSGFGRLFNRKEKAPGPVVNVEGGKQDGLGTSEIRS